MLQIVLDNEFEENSTNSCLNLCKSTSGCEWFSYNSPDSFCGLYVTCDEYDTSSCELCVTGKVAFRLADIPADTVRRTAEAISGC